MHLDGEEQQRLRHALTDSLGRVDLNVLRGYVKRKADMLIDGFPPAVRRT